MGTQLDTYLFQALDAYPYDLQETVASLNYALSYDDRNPTALCLLGRIYSDTLSDYETAKNYFQEALAENMHAFGVYPYYIDVLLWNEDYKEAEKIICFALTLKGADKGMLYLKKALLLEQKEAYNDALQSIKLAKKHTYNNDFMSILADHKKRVKEKMPRKKKKKATNKKPSSKKERKTD